MMLADLVNRDVFPSKKKHRVLDCFVFLQVEVM